MLLVDYKDYQFYIQCNMAKPLTTEFLISKGQCCGKGCANCPYWPRHEKGSTKVEIIKLLDEWLDDIEKGELILASSARKCYMNKEHQLANIITWVHDNELKNYLILRGLSGTADRVIQR